MHETARRIGLIGDVHGSAPVAERALRILRHHGVTEAHFLGDFGMIWNGDDRSFKAVKWVSRILDELGMTAYVTGGNHEGYTRWNEYPVRDDGLRWPKPRLALLPRGWRATTPSGRSVASLGGANSPDRFKRNGRGWWAEEAITEQDLADLGDEPVDVLLAHDAPMSQLLLHRLAAVYPSGLRLFGADGLAYADIGHRMFHRGFLQVRPLITFSGHYHQFLDTFESYVHGDEPFESRSVILNADGKYPTVAICDTEDLSVEFFEFDRPDGPWKKGESTAPPSKAI